MAKLLVLILSSLLLLCTNSATSMVRRDERKQLMATEYGEISSVDVRTLGNRGPYHLEFFTLEPNSLFLPVLLHADTVFYVRSGSGKLSWTGEEGEGEVQRVDLKRGDVYRLEPGSVFFLQSGLENERQKLRIHAIFSTTNEDVWEPWIGAYSSLSDLVLGFDTKLLQSAFRVTEGVIEEVTREPKPPMIVHTPASDEKEQKKKKKKSVFYELENRFLKIMTGEEEEAGVISLKKSKKSKTFNILEANPDFQNCNGWSLTVDKGNYKTLKGSNVGVFMVNLTKGAMMSPHWNPMATEIAVVLEGEGMVRIVCAANSTTRCENKRFMASEGDVFVVPRFHPMAQMSFNNGSFVFAGFSTSSKKNHPQFLAGKSSVFQTLDRDVLAVAFNTSNTTIEQLLLAPQEDAVILECVSCAEEELRLMKEEIEREREEEEEQKRREEEEERKREEEEERKRREEEEEERKRQEEEERKRREEEEEERKRREEEARREREEEARREQEEARKEEEERQRKREEAEEEAQREREEEEERQRREEEARREQEEARKEEEERQRKREEAEEEARREREEEEERQRKEEEKEAREKEKEEEEERQRREEEAREKEEEEEEERQKREQEARRQEEEWQRRREEEEEERERREEAAEREQEEARRQEEERQRRREEEQEHEGGGGGERRRTLLRQFPSKPWAMKLQSK